MTSVSKYFSAQYNLCDRRIKESLETASQLIGRLVSTAMYGMSSAEALTVVSDIFIRHTSMHWLTCRLFNVVICELMHYCMAATCELSHLFERNEIR